MSFTAKDVLWAVKTALQDASNTHWTLEELRIYLNDGLKEIAFQKPTAVSETAELDLVEGTLQTLPAGQQMIRVVRNITSASGVTPRVAGKNITPIDREVLDSQMPNWHDNATVPFSDYATHVMMDPVNPRVFYTYPGNTGDGRIEAIVSTIPDAITQPANPLDIDNYTQVVDLPDIYQNALRDYILSRAYEKDSGVAGAAQRSVMHFQKFQQALGLRQQVEAVANINTTEQT